MRCNDRIAKLKTVRILRIADTISLSFGERYGAKEPTLNLTIGKCDYGGCKNYAGRTYRKVKIYQYVEEFMF